MDDISSMNFWERLDETILKKGYSRKELAKDLGFSVGNFGSWKAREDYPTADKLANIAAYLNTTVEYLLTGDYGHEWGLPPLITSIVNDLLPLEDSDLRCVSIMIHALAIDRGVVSARPIDPEYVPLASDLAKEQKAKA